MRRKKSKDEDTHEAEKAQEMAEIMQEDEENAKWIENGIQLSLFNEEPLKKRRMGVSQS